VEGVFHLEETLGRFERPPKPPKAKGCKWQETQKQGGQGQKKEV